MKQTLEEAAREGAEGYNKSMWCVTNGFVEDKYITHWSPIPALPKGGEE